jgi:hypothetical protein
MINSLPYCRLPVPANPVFNVGPPALFVISTFSRFAALKQTVQQKITANKEVIGLESCSFSQGLAKITILTLSVTKL